MTDRKVAKIASAIENFFKPKSYGDPHEIQISLDGCCNSGHSGQSLTGATNLQEVGYHGVLTVTAVPEPGTYAMLLAGLGLMGGIARRRKQSK